MANIKNLNNDSVRFEDGSASSPSISFIGDTNTGIYRVSGDSGRFYFTADGTAAVRIDANGLALQNKTLYIQSGRKVNFDYGVSNNYYIIKDSTTLNMHSPVNLSLQTNSSHRLYINQSGNVGIGTTSPGQKLDVEGKIRAKGGYYYIGTNSTSYLAVDNGANVYLRTNATHYFEGNGFQKGVWSASGNLGIGTTSPTYKFEVHGNTAASHRLRVVNAGTGQSSVDLKTSTQETRLIGFNGKPFYVYDQTASSELFTIKSGGNVGIGVTNPDRKLNVNGRVTFYEYSGSWATNIAHSNFQVATLINNSAGTSGSSIGSYMKISAAATGATGTFSDFRSRAYAENTTVNTDWLVNYLAEYRDYTSTSSVTLSNHAGLWVKSLGVGGSATVTNNYGVYLDVGTNATNNYGIYQIGSNVENYFQGKVGIGTTTPHRLLDVRNESGIGEQVIAGTTGATLYFRPNTAYSSGGNFGIFTTGLTSGTYESTMTFKGYGNGVNDVMTIKGLGNVGIGYTSPSFKLDVNGSMRLNGEFNLVDGNVTLRRVSDGLRLMTSNLDRMTVTSNGNVGIGTTSPSYKLDISGGDIRINRSDARLLIGWNLGSGGIQLEGGASTASTLFFKSDRFRFYTSSAQEIVSLTQAGNVGIGDTTPTRELTVNGDIGVKNSGKIYLWDSHNSNYIQYDKWTTSASAGMTITNQSSSGGLSLQTNSSTRLFISSSGNVGIGTASPAEKLEIYDGNIKLNDGTRNLIIGEEGGSSYQIKSSGYLIVDATSGIQLNKTTSGNITIASGNVGIGITSPSYPLDVNGRAQFRNDVFINGSRVLKNVNNHLYLDSATGYGIYLRPNNGSTAMYINSSGNVGIGTASPSEKLHVAGNIRATGWIGRDSSNYITFDETNNHIDFYAGGNWVARMEADGDLHVKGDVIAFSDIFNP